MPEENKPPQGLTEEQLTAWMDQNLGKTVNNMLTARLGTFEKKITENITTSLGKTLEEKLSVFQTKRPEDPPPDDGAKDGKDKEGRRAREASELANVKAELAAMRKASEEAQARATALELRSREMQMRQKTSQILGNAGIGGHHFEAAYALLTSQGRVKVIDDPYAPEPFVFSDPATGDISLEIGLEQWLKSDIAKIFLPASGVRGSGSAPTRGRGPNGKEMTADERSAFVANRLADELGR